jgi:hypothetical protein
MAFHPFRTLRSASRLQALSLMNVRFESEIAKGTTLQRIASSTAISNTIVFEIIQKSFVFSIENLPMSFANRHRPAMKG